MANHQKTYFLAPTRDAPPDGTIVLGNIISDPKWPEETVLNDSLAPISPALGPWKNVKTGAQYAEDRAHDTTVGVFARFLQFLGFGPEVEGSAATIHKMTTAVRSMETQYFVPSNSYLKTAMAAPEVQDYLATRHVWALSRPLFMVTGIKIARGASATSEYLKKRRLHAQVSVDLAVFGGTPVTIGQGLNRNRSTGETTSWTSSDDFVFAYRLHKIILKRSGEIKSSLYTTGASHSIEEDAKKEAESYTYEVAFETEDKDYSGQSLGAVVSDAIDEDGEVCTCLAIGEDD